MEENKNKKGKKIVLISVVLLLVIVIIVGITCVMLNSSKLEFYNITFELGQSNYIEELTKQENVYIKDGYTYTIKENKVDIKNVGIYEMVFEIKGKGKVSEEIKEIIIQDTTPPTVELKKDTFYIGDNINVEEIISIKDLSQVKEITCANANAQIEGQFDTSKEGTSTIKITVEDKNGNKRTQQLRINVKNPIVSKYYYITNMLKNSNEYTLSAENNDIVIKYANSFSKGWINYTDKIAFDTWQSVNTYLTISSASIMYFDDTYNVYKAEVYDNYYWDDDILNKLTKIPKRTITSKDSDIGLYQIKNKVNGINRYLNDNENKLQLIGKTIEEIKNETVDLREFQ